ncbi:hypothetical protein V9K97_11960 [Variovorax sp. CCNWLW186]|jgi:hypothetical protein|uniref:DUF7710 domain-containing protein n=1 Tax=Variovorax sp. CCNWLW186 TaxID=3127473 RepID=UPI0030772F05
MNSVWVFNGAGGRFPSAIFEEKSEAEEWIRKHRLTGVLTKYPVGTSVYQWALETDNFKIKNERDQSPEFIQKFSSAAQEHMHYENGSSD